MEKRHEIPHRGSARFLRCRRRGGQRANHADARAAAGELGTTAAARFEPVADPDPALARPAAVSPEPGGSGAAIAPLDQQKMQSYRNDLIGRQRMLEQQGVSPGAEPYRTNQQQLNQLNGSSR